MGVAGQGAEARIAPVVELHPHHRHGGDAAMDPNEREAGDDWDEYQRCIEEDEADSVRRASEVGRAPSGRRAPSGGRTSRYGASSYGEERRRAKQEAKAQFDAATWLERLGHNVVRNPKGATLSCPIPGHSDSDPSFSLLRYDDGWGWNCFGCRRKGDSIALVEAVLGCNPAEAIAEVHRFSGVEVPERRKGASRRATPRPVRRGVGTLEATEAAPSGRGHHGRVEQPNTDEVVAAATSATHASATDGGVHGHRLDPDAPLGPIPLALVRKFERISESDALRLADQLHKNRISGRDGLLMKWVGSRMWTETIARHADIHMAQRIYGRDEARVTLTVARHPFYGAGNRVLGWADRVQSCDWERTRGKRWLANAGKPPPLVGAHTVSTQGTVLVAEGVSDWITLMDNAPTDAAALCVPGTGFGADASRELVALLRGRQVVVFGDRDDAGAGLGALVAATATAVGMKFLMVECETKDISDLLSDGARVYGPEHARNKLRRNLLQIVTALSEGWIPSGHTAPLRLL